MMNILEILTSMKFKTFNIIVQFQILYCNCEKRLMLWANEHLNCLSRTLSNFCWLMVVLVLGLDVVLDDIMSWTLLAPIADDDRWASDDLPGLALGIQLAKTGPLAQLLVGVNLDDGDLRNKMFIVNQQCRRLESKINAYI